MHRDRPACSPNPADPQLDSEEQAFVTLINNYRAQNGLGALAVDWKIQPAADWMSWDMGQPPAYFSHTDRLGRSPWTRMCEIGYCYNTWKGENIAAGFTTAQTVFTAWQNSPGHNANMLGAHYTAMGISRVYTAGSPYGWYWTNDFGGVDSNASPPGATASPAPTAAPTTPPTPAPTPPPTPAPTAPSGSTDTDSDGYSDLVEAFVGTSTTLDCPLTIASRTTSRLTQYPRTSTTTGSSTVATCSPSHPSSRPTSIRLTTRATTSIWTGKSTAATC